MSKKTNKKPANSIVENKKARFDYFIEETIEAGIALEGWELKSLRAGKIQLVDSYVLIKNGEAFLLGALISPLTSVSSHITPDSTRTRKLLLHKSELEKLIIDIQKKGKTCICTRLYWKRHLVKAAIALGQGKQKQDKRATEKERDWNIQKQRVMRSGNTKTA